MKIVRVTTGNWFPRTKIHLREYYRFLVDGTSHLSIDKELLRIRREALGATNVQYVGLADEGRFDHVVADFKESRVTYFEDGLIVAERQVDSLADDVFILNNFYTESVLGALGTIYSIGLPAISIHDPRYTQRPTIFLASSCTDDEAAELAGRFDDRIHYTARHERHVVHFGDRVIIVVTKQVHTMLTTRIIRMLLFFREFESRLDNFLNLHRTIWTDIEAIRSSKVLSLRDLPKIRDRLLDFDRDLTIIVARLAQMSHFLSERRLEVNEFERPEYFRALEAYRFGKLQVMTNYISDLWSQLDEYLASVSDLIGLMYQEQLQKGLNVLQFLFIVGSVASVLILGNMSDSNITLFDSSGRFAVQGSVEGFSVSDLVLFGGAATIISLIFYLLVNLFVSRFRRIDTEYLLGERRPFAKQQQHGDG